uniref:RWP-RK domain-containing protein n=1 Tax=Quercus lobata TaxID=97700 RepID=A0A7N2MGY2_QUELO
MKCSEERCCRSKISSKETIPQYFYMPITQAAKEPNLGLAPLKKRCREPNLRLAPLEKRCRGSEVDEPPRNHACDKADGPRCSSD